MAPQRKLLRKHESRRWIAFACSVLGLCCWVGCSRRVASDTRLNQKEAAPAARGSVPDSSNPRSRGQSSTRTAPVAESTLSSDSFQFPVDPLRPMDATHAPLESDSLSRRARALEPPNVDEDQLHALRIRRITGTHLVLFTDLPPLEPVDRLPAVFDLAVEKWCDYFSVPLARSDGLRWYACLMQEPDRFRRADLLPSDLPPFHHGYQRGAMLWLYEQESDYYRQHLLLHEGTHAFMQWALDGVGPPWYMEGMAELLATHRWAEGKLELMAFPAGKEATPGWGRIKSIKEDVNAGQFKTLQQVMAYDERAHREVAAYAWSWAAAVFLESHPRSQPLFRALKQRASDRTPRFSLDFYRQLADGWPLLRHEWDSFVTTIEYGFDIRREAVGQKRTASLPAEGAAVKVLAERGWQSTGWQLRAGTTYRIRATGRYQVADDPDIWWCEPNGITLRYHARRPLGLLLGAVVDLEHPAEESSFVDPEPLGLDKVIRPSRRGTLFLRINDSPAELGDNRGQLTVQVTQADSE